MHFPGATIAPSTLESAAHTQFPIPLLSPSPPLHLDCLPASQPGTDLPTERFLSSAPRCIHTRALKIGLSSVIPGPSSSLSLGVVSLNLEETSGRSRGHPRHHGAIESDRLRSGYETRSRLEHFNAFGALDLAGFLIVPLPSPRPPRGIFVIT